MAKQGLTVKNVLNLVNNEKSWALCVGSGISYPLFPLWNELAKKIVHKFVPKADRQLDKLSERLSSEMLLQSAADMSKADHNAFSRELASTLYEDLFRNLSNKEKKSS